MIFVDRTRSVEPPVLQKRFTDGKTETQRATEHYADPWDGTTFTFRRYKADPVKDELEKLFHGKCAYCESRYRHVSPEDIEHWRPKASVTLANGTEKKPAYYWLGATWTNLLPSCPDCNRRRRQEDARDPANPQSGKNNHFPVADENNRWTHPNQPNQNNEVPLILDPCADDPDRFLFVEEDAVVHERQPAGTQENVRARASIDVYGLNRSGLVAERREHRLRIVGLLHDIDLATRQLQTPLPGPVADATWANLRTKLATVKSERGSESCYLMMKLPLIDDFMATIGPALQTLGIGR